MIYEELRPKLRRDQPDSYRGVIVSGPQRSGTRIAAQIIAADTLRYLLFEEAIEIDDVSRLLGAFRNLDVPFVIQAPALSYLLHELPWMTAAVPGFTPKDLAVVFMRRPLGEIRASEARIGWRDRGEHRREKKKYQQEPAVAHLVRGWRPIARTKMLAWDGVQMAELLAHGAGAFDLEYHSLEEHELWIPKERRAGFLHNQTMEV